VGGGAYFVSQDDNPQRLDDLCRQLALRGVTCLSRSHDIERR
jgi:hypothetical protein